MKKIFIPLLCILFVLCMAFPAFAEEEAPEATSAPVTVTETPAETETTEAPPTATEKSESTVSEISDAIKEWTPEIMSAAALVFSAIITYLFKKALLPGVAKALTKIDGSVEQYNELAKKLVDTLTEELKLSKEETSALMEKFTVSETEMRRALDVSSKILLAQSESLFELLEHTNLPADVKAEIAAMHKAQAAEIAKLMGGGSDEE
jgi:polyhydroxyalkanoate synthesis regulator phasin